MTAHQRICCQDSSLIHQVLSDPPEITHLNEASLTNIADMISKGKISIKPDTQVLYNSRWMQEFTKYHNRKTRKELRMLQFANPGKFLEDFDPEKSSREMRKVNRKIYTETVRKNQMYDDKGRLIASKLDLCDCLEDRCPGCHFPCPRCGSEKCGVECRCSRRWIYLEIAAEVGGYRTVFPGSD